MNRNEIDIKEFQESITQELDIVRSRVRNLIGRSHWGEDGRYKEAVLRNVIKRFLPYNLSLGTGFIIKKSQSDQFKISKQIDIIIYDNTIPVLFSEGDFIITTHKNVKGIIEVKTKIRNSDLQTILSIATENGKLIGKEKFNGVFSYEYDGERSSLKLRDVLKESKGYVNHLSLGKNVFVKFWKRADRYRLNPPVECNSDFYNIYELNGLSFSYYISNILTYVCDKKLDDRLWFLFPIEGTKEIYRRDTVCVD